MKKAYILLALFGLMLTGCSVRGKEIEPTASAETASISTAITTETAVEITHTPIDTEPSKQICYATSTTTESTITSVSVTEQPTEVTSTATSPARSTENTANPSAEKKKVAVTSTAKENANGAIVVQSLLPYILKTPYVFGGESFENGFDCSGLSVTAYRTVGVEIPHSAAILTSEYSQKVDKHHLLPGDIMGDATHVLMFAGWADYPMCGDVAVPDMDGELVNLMELSAWELNDETNLEYLNTEWRNPDRKELFICKNQLQSYTFKDNEQYYRSEFRETTVRIGLTLNILPNGVLTLHGRRYEDWNSDGYRVCENTAPSAEFPDDITKYVVQ